jgi:preprotein translocase subunit YajC
MHSLATMLAQAGDGGAGGGGGGGSPPAAGFGNILILILPMIVLFYFLIIRPQKKQESAQRRMLEELRKGDRVYTYGGIIGRVVEVRDREIVLKVDEGNGTRMHFIKAAVKGILRDEDEKDDKADKADAAKPEEAKSGS